MRRNVGLSGKGLSKELKKLQDFGGRGGVKNGFPGSQILWSLLWKSEKEEGFPSRQAHRLWVKK